MNHNHIVGGDGITMNLYHVFAIFLVVGSADSIGRKLAGLTYGDKSGTKFEGKNRTADKTTGLNSDYFSNAFVAVKLRKIPPDDMKTARIFKKSCDVAEYDSFLREIIDITNASL